MVTDVFVPVGALWWGARLARFDPPTTGVASGGGKGMVMSKVRIVCFALLAVVAFGAFGASSAMAETRWLVEGKTFTGTLSAETEGELGMLFLAGPSNEILYAILCSFILAGTITNPGLDKVEDLLTLEMVQVGEGLSGEFLHCVDGIEAGGVTDCKERAVALVWVENINLSVGAVWSTELLLEGTMFWDDFSSNSTGKFPGFEVECETLAGFIVLNVCEGNIRALLENTAGTVPFSVLSIINNEAANRMSCTFTGEKSGGVESENDNTWAIAGELERLETAVSDG